jgi:RimJ/RimL family protein N-acetyltransferase
MLQGERVTLRAIERSDLPKLWELRNDAAVESISNGAPKPRSMAEIEAWFDGLAKDKDFQPFAIEAGGEFVGQCNIRSVDPVNRRAEVGISLLPEHTSKGYGSDAMRILLNYAFRHLNLHKVCLDTLSVNEPALRSYRACGFVEEGRLRQHEWYDGGWVDLVLMAVLRDEWTPAQVTLR